MSAQETEELRRRLEEAERRQLDAERRRIEAEQRQTEAEQQLNEERLQTRNTTLPEFLDACHIHLSLGLSIQEDKDSSTKGDPANADKKLRPDSIREWTSFPEEQIALWEDIMDTQFITGRHFSPVLVLRDMGKEVRGRMLSSELDLGYFERQTVESRVSSVIKELHANRRLRDIFHLNGDVAFENHANSLTDESKIVEGIDSLNLDMEQQPRYSKRLAAKQSEKTGSSYPGQSLARSREPARARTSRPRADQFCVYNKGPETKIPAFIIEYKAPHKLSTAHIKAGLQDMELDRVVRYQEGEKPEDICRRVVAAVITQTFSYMIEGGLEYGYVCTGEAFVFLRVLHDDPATAYYYLSVPKEDVGKTTGWTGDLGGDNRLHLTALGQVLAFTLRALRTSPRDTTWTDRAGKTLKTWEMLYDDILGKIEEKDVPSSDYRPSRQSRQEYCRASPIKTRSKSVMSSAALCGPSQGPNAPNRDDDSSDEFDPDTPSQRPRGSHLSHRSTTLPPKGAAAMSRGGSNSKSKGKSRQYCTQQCLLGLTRNAALDRECPNVLEHGIDRHQIDRAMFFHLLDQQLSNDDVGPDLDLGCESLHIHGTRGALFKVTLLSHGYTFVGKGVPIEFLECSNHEEFVYSRLDQIQGKYVPVVLGSLVLSRAFSYDGIAQIVHIMFMSYAGRTLCRQHDIDQVRLVRQADKALHAIHQSGVLHNDPIPGNMIWNVEMDQVMFIDFERARVQERSPLTSISPNSKRKREDYTLEKSSNKRWSHFATEARRMRHGLR